MSGPVSTADTARPAALDAAPPAWASDRSGLIPDGTPAEHVIARNVDEVRATLARANAAGIPVVTRGAGSGLAGGAVAGAGSIVLDLSRLDRILAIDPVEQLARVEAGVVTATLDAAAREHGLFYAPDPGSVGISTIGGNIATNAGGLRGAKYGVTRDAVLGLDVVLADGRLLTLGRSTLKGVAGYELAGLFVGSEGTLGVVVGATLRLLPVPVATATASAYFDTVEAAAAAVTAIAAAGVRASVIELLDGATLAELDRVHGGRLAERGDALLLVQTDGFGAEAELDAAIAAIAPSAALIERATDAAEAEALLAVRRAALPALETLGPLLIEDVAVPRGRLAEAVAGIRAIAADTGARIFVFGHAGDGNLHPIVLAGEPGGPVSEAAQTAAARIFELALELGGTITAEHGVGLLKQPWLARELGEPVLAAQRELRRLFDPRGILNPGKAV